MNTAMHIVSVAGAAVILALYALLVLGRLSTTRVTYHALALVGGVLLNVAAIYDGRAGFVLLESSWCVIALFGIVRTWGKR